ncbi:hypothetical protein NDU88_006284 [Pleurodeles waltl]|uniref:Uncharacterized protein n=1 Tax=Pleurodeles waltl TaxID=8319 RepID=A0AAV7RND9_PLEWA|nr:hypothetical protein NDU88_006284 [Pleurodeles waltl]
MALGPDSARRSAVVQARSPANTPTHQPHQRRSLPSSPAPGHGSGTRGGGSLVSHQAPVGALVAAAATCSSQCETSRLKTETGSGT